MDFNDTFIQKHYMLVRKENIIFAKWCKKHKMSYMDIHILIAVYSNNGISEPTVLSEELLIPKQTTTSILDKLEKNNFIKRLHSDNDRRKIYIEILEKGKKLVVTALNEFNNAEKNIRNKINSNELENILKTYEKTIQIIENSLLK